MTNEALVAAVRAECGKVSNTIDIADVDITREAAFILRRISSTLPERVVRSITTSEGVSEYDAHASTVRVEGIFQLAEDQAEAIFNFNTRIDSAERSLWPSIDVIDEMRRKRAATFLRYNFHPVRRKILLAKTPDSDDVELFYISVEEAVWTLATLPASFEELVVTGTTWKSLEIIALRRTTEGGIMREGGRVDYPADALRKFIDAKKKEFEDDLATATRRNFGAF